MLDDIKTVVKTQRAARPAAGPRRNFQTSTAERQPARKISANAATKPNRVVQTPSQKQARKASFRWPQTVTVSQLLRNVSLWRLQNWSYISLALCLVGSFAIVGFTVHGRSEAKRYVLSSATKKLVGQAAPGLDAKISYSTKLAAYRYNPSAADGIKSNAAAAGDKTATIGGSNYYGVDLAKAAKNGQTFTDAQTKLSFSLVPQFGALDGKQVDGHIVYPVGAGQAIYTLKDNGLKEDVVVSKVAESVTLKYALKLPSTLEARTLSDGSVGIYSADPALFGNISYGSSTDQSAVEKARRSAQKTNLVFQIPAPVITETGKAVGSGVAKFVLAGNELTVQATNLSRLSYPISIDPSVVIQSANSFTNGNNEDGNATITTGSVSRGTLTGGLVNQVSSDTSCATTTTWCSVQTGTAGVNGGGTGGGGARMNATIAYKGFIYSIGGNYNLNASSLNTVSYASLNSSTGTVGSWNVGSTLVGGVGLSDFGSAVYNGYLYVIGGMQQGGVAIGTIQYALICSGTNTTGGCSGKPAGSVGTWTASTAGTNFSTIDSVAYRGVFGAVAYNGYMYVMGGLNTNTNAVLGDTLFAPILANGDIGPWAVTTALPYKGTTVATVSNGRIYVGMACDQGNQLFATGGCTATSTIEIGTIASNGSISSWTAGASYSVFGSGVTLSASIMVANGYLYVAGGLGFTAATSYAPIYANGSIGTAIAATPFTSGRSQFMLASSNGYLYEVGGYLSSSSAPYIASDTQYAKIDPSGSSAPFVSQGTYDTTANARINPAIAVYNNYIYLIGGYLAANNTVLSSIRYVKINTDGSLGTWATTSQSMTTARNGAAAAVANGYLYVSTGTPLASESGYIATTEYAPIATNGDITTAFTVTTSANSCSSATPYPCSASDNGMEYASSVAYNGNLYLIGGRHNNNSNSYAYIWYAPLTPSTGAVGVWKTATATIPTSTGAVGTNGGSGTNLSDGLALSGVTMNGSYLYIVGGAFSGSAFGGVYYSKIDSTGDITTAFSSGPMIPGATSGRDSMDAYVSNGYLYASGGYYNGTAYNSTYYAKLGANGAPAAWVTTGALTSGRFNAVAAANNGYAYVIGGCSTIASLFSFDCNAGGTLNDVTAAYIGNGGGGNTLASSWTTGASDSVSDRIGAGSFVSNGYLYAVGGCQTWNVGCTSGNIFSSIESVPLNSDGSMGSWTVLAPTLPTRSFYNGTVFYKGYVYVMGGCSAGMCTTANSTVYYAQVLSGGAIGSWQTGTSFPTGSGMSARLLISADAYNGYMYVFGGMGAGANTGYSDVWSAPINKLGGIGAWSQTTSMPSTRAGAQSFINNGYAYVVGGQDNYNGNTFGTSWYAPVNNGTVGAWQTTTSMNVPRADFGLTAYNGYVYATGGYSSSGVTLSTEYAPVLSNGGIGPWTSMPNVSGNYTEVGVISAAYNGYLYVGYGFNNGSGGGAGYNLATYYIPLSALAHTATYSRLIDLASTVNGNPDGNPQITRYNFIGNGTADGVNFCATSATSANPILSASLCGSPFAYSSPVAAKSYGRYSFVTLAIDDSANASFPDTNPTSLTELDAYFHASPGRRLRGGQTFTDSAKGTSTINQLDTEGP